MQKGIQIYNGQRWQNIFIGKDSSKINPLHTPRLYKLKSFKDILLVAGSQTAGFLQPNKRGKLLYYEIANRTLIKEKLDFIKHIEIKGREAFFLGLKGILVLDILSRKSKFFKNNFNAKYVFYYEIEGNIIARFDQPEIYQLDYETKEWEQTSQYSFINKKTSPKKILELKDKRYIVVDKNNHILVVDKNSLAKLDKQLDTLFKDQYFFSLKQFRDKVYIKTEKYIIVYDLTRKNILYKKQISSRPSDFAITEQGNIWLSTLTRGILFIEINSIFKIKAKDLNIKARRIFGDVTVTQYQDYSFEIKLKKWRKKYKSVITGSIRHISEFNDQIFFITSKGIFTFQTQQKQLAKISSDNTFLVHQSISNPFLFYQFTDKYFKILQKERNSLIVLDSIKFNDFVYSVVERHNSIWVAAEIYGIKRIRLSSDGKAIKNIKHYLSQKKSEQASFSAFIFRDKPCFNNSSGVFFYDKAADSIKRYAIKYDSSFSKKYTEDFVQHYTFLHVINNDSILVTPGITSEFNTPGILVYKSGYFEWQNSPFKRMKNYRYKNLEKLNNKTYCLHTAHLIYELTPSQKVNTTYKFKTHIRDVSVQIPFVDLDNHKKLSDSTIYTSYTTIKSPTKLNYSNNTLTFTYASDSWAAYERNEYSYQLIGQDDTWSNWSKEQKKEYTNLREGTYTFQVRCKNVYGTISSVDTYTFTILPPWYRTWWAYTLYLLVGVSLMVAGSIGYNQYRSRQLRKRNRELEQTVALRTEEISGQKAEITQQAAQLKITNESLNAANTQLQVTAEELKTTNEELHKTNLELQTTNEALEDANAQIKKEQEDRLKYYVQRVSDSNERFVEMIDIFKNRGLEVGLRFLENELNTAGKMASIQAEVREAYPEFIAKLDKVLLDEDITYTQWKVGQCLKLGKSANEISALLDVKPSTIYSYGSRLRKAGLL
ncbi:triple tyrosine motif-containing protein [uncultured Microscilla sp.]|uniref:triple tyrosine motif-containing protein n=1 Tax=uncultured Microscilla sp. TaxID=432653 RepID=UPI00261ED3A3|nr:triple tyrosine motif-containing protein [uncultured Microscilla sp.]